MKMGRKTCLYIICLLIPIIIGIIAYYFIPSPNKYYVTNKNMSDLLVSRYVYTQLFNKDYPDIFSSNYETIQYNSGVVIKINFQNKSVKYYVNNTRLKQIIYGQ